MQGEPQTQQQSVAILPGHLIKNPGDHTIKINQSEAQFIEIKDNNIEDKHSTLETINSILHLPDIIQNTVVIKPNMKPDRTTSQTG